MTRSLGLAFSFFSLAFWSSWASWAGSIKGPRTRIVRNRRSGMIADRGEGRRDELTVFSFSKWKDKPFPACP
jgi:hypothetical protein